jgi:hypothetical protein
LLIKFLKTYQKSLKKIGILDWIWMGNPDPKKIQKLQTKNIQKSGKSKNPRNPKSKHKIPFLIGFLNYSVSFVFET